MQPLKSWWVILPLMVVGIGLGQVAWGQDAASDEAQALLKEGLAQYKALNFLQAKKVLLKVDRNKLTGSQRNDLDSHLLKVDDVIKKQAAAREAYDAGSKALKANDLATAAAKFDIAAASTLLPDADRKDARAQRALVAKKIEAARLAAATKAPKPDPKPKTKPEPKTKPTPKPKAKPKPSKAPAQDKRLAELQKRFNEAKAETVKGDQAMAKGQMDAAGKHFQRALEVFPEYGPARKKLAQVQGLLVRSAGPGMQAIGRLQKLRRIRKQETEVRFSQAIKRARESLQMAKGPAEYGRAAEEVKYAQTLLVTGKSLFTDTEYRAKKIETDQLLDFIGAERTRWEIDRVRIQEEEIRLRMTRRAEEMARQRREKIDTLKSRAIGLRDEQKYVQSVEILDRIRKLDPDDSWAAEQYNTLSRFVLLLDEKEAYRVGLHEEQRSLVDVRWSAIPWYELLRYPRDWPEITLKRQAFGASRVSESEANRAVYKALRMVLPKLDFGGIAFGDVIQFVRDVSNVNIHVKWEALRQVNIDQKTQVNVKLVQVSVEKALRTILDDVGGVNPLGYVVDEGVISVSTKDDLSRQTVTRVYDIRDLIVRVPDFRGPRINLSSS
ncbi:hypothetical protein LCGC14_1938690, partial [marine sediment metagenome]